MPLKGLNKGSSLTEEQVMESNSCFFFVLTALHCCIQSLVTSLNVGPFLVIGDVNVQNE